MLLKKVDKAKVATILAHHVDIVSCLQCCKYYIVPERSTCGHTLCHTCWRGLKACPACGSSVDRKALRPDRPMQALANHVRVLVEAYELSFSVKMDDFVIDPPVKEKEVDPSKHVKEWLTNSDNHFSAPPYSDTQQSTQDILPLVTLSTSKIQIHAEQPNRSLSPKRVAHVSLPQDDWDKIEVIQDTEDITHKNKENVVGPMDLEPFFVDENEYSNEHPRRSSRKRDNKNENTSVTPIKIDDNQNSEVERKLDKAKQNWTNVKKMKKEFSKLNKLNKNKLNVSIEMCKKTQSVKSKQNSATPPNVDVEEIVIEDNTPNVLNDKTNKPMISSDKGYNVAVDKVEILCSKSILDKNYETCTNIIKKTYLEHKEKLIEENCDKQKKNATSIEDTVCRPENINKTPVELTLERDVKATVSKCAKESTIKIPFIKKSKFQHYVPNIPRNVESSTDSTSNPEDIHITIRVGDVVTNITINKKHNDVQLKVNTDREIQTSFSPNPTPKVNIDQPEPITTMERHQHTMTQVQGSEKNLSQKSVVKKALDKSVSTKKQTASAETATAHFEITESVEKELSNIMECDETESIKVDEVANTVIIAKSASVQKHTQDTVKTKPASGNVVQPTILDKRYPEGADLDEIDIFNSGSVKDQNVQLLKDAHYTLSEVIPTYKTNKNKTQTEKRKRDIDNEDLISKRQKVDTPNKDDKEYNKTSDSPNYDDVMGELFAKIDDEMEEIKSQKLQCSKKIGNSEKKTTQIYKRTQESNVDNQVLGKTQTIDRNMGEKFSENMFSTVGNVIEKGNAHVPGPETQQNIANLLTPGMCSDLVRSSQREEVILCTPLDDDSDKSVVEETPQKNTSLPKSKSRSDSGNQPPKRLSLSKPNNGDENKASNIDPATPHSEDISSIINLTDTVRESRLTRVTSLARKDTLETPVTINRFVDEIKHNSTPVARKSLNFAKNDTDDGDQTLCPTHNSDIAKTTQEKQFMTEAFENRANTPLRAPLIAKNLVEDNPAKFVIAGSCLSSTQMTNLKILCFKRKWMFVDKFTPALTHLVVTVDEEGKSQRSVKYMCALASSKWIVSYKWVEKCLETNTVANEEPYEALDSTGDAGPYLSRTAKRKVFDGYTFYCMPPFSVLDVGSLTSMLKAAGGRVVTTASEVRVTGSNPTLLLAEPEHTQEEDKFYYLAIELNIVPVNYEWTLNCLGSYTISSLHNLLLCSVELLPKLCSTWPPELLAIED